MRPAAIALVHHPVLGRRGEVLTTTLTNLDLHDMARSARTYGMQTFYIVHPLSSQRLVAERIQRHWVDGPGGERIPDRARALRLVEVVTDVEGAVAALAEATGTAREEVEIWTTAAREQGGALTTYAEGRRILDGEGPPVLVLFGTGWGLTEELLGQAHRRLEPIRARRDTDFNHLSVRAACAITLDRLFG